MNEIITRNFSKAINFVKALDKKKRNRYLLILVGCALTAIILTIVLNHKDYVVLYRDLEIEECADIAKRLDEMSIPSKVVKESTIYVEKKDEPKVKLQLASEGYPKSALNYDIFTKNIDFMTTDYEKTKYSLFQLQERLQAAIKTLDSIKSAIVTITLPEQSLAVLDEDKTEPSASVLIEVLNGVQLSQQQTKGIEQLVAKSVPGLKTDNISIVDQSGTVLNDKSDNTLINTTGRMNAEKEISKLFSDRILSVLSPIYGKKNISVGVNVVLDYTKRITEKTEYTPSKGNAGVISRYDKTYEGAAGGAANAGVPGTEPNTEVPGYETAAGNQGNNTISDKVSVDYVISQLKEQIQKEGAEIKDTTISILINKENMSNNEVTKITEIVANTAGVNVDKVAFHNMEFSADKSSDGVKTPIEPPFSFRNVFSLKNLGWFILAILLLAILTLLLVRYYKKIKRLKQRRLLLNEQMFGKGQDMQEAIKENNIDLKITETKEQQLAKELREFSLKSPQITAKLLRTLLKGDSK